MGTRMQGPNERDDMIVDQRNQGKQLVNNQEQLMGIEASNT